MKKDETGKYTRKVTIRFKESEYNQLQRLFKRSASNKLSDYARKVLQNKPVIIVYRNQSTDDFLAVTGSLVKTLNGIGNNFNQAVKKLHILKGIEEFKGWYITWNLDRQILINKVDEVKKIIGKIYEDGRKNSHTEPHSEGTEL